MILLRLILPSSTMLLHLGPTTRTVYGLDPIIVSLAAFWCRVLVVAIWRRRDIDL